MDYPSNPNGAIEAIAGICDPTGRLMGMMPHPEAYLHRTNHPRWTGRTCLKKEWALPFSRMRWTISAAI